MPREIGSLSRVNDDGTNIIVSQDRDTAQQPDRIPLTAFFATITGFALILHIWWLVAVGVIAAYAVFVWFAWRDVAEYEIPAEEVARIDRARRAARRQWLEANASAGGPA